MLNRYSTGSIKFEFDLREIVDKCPWCRINKPVNNKKGTQKDIEFDCCSVNLIFFSPSHFFCCQLRVNSRLNMFSFHPGIPWQWSNKKEVRNIGNFSHTIVMDGTCLPDVNRSWKNVIDGRDDWIMVTLRETATRLCIKKTFLMKKKGFGKFLWWKISV